jgi:Chaperone of endosialidase
MKNCLVIFALVFISTNLTAQNVGISITTPTEKLHVDSGNIKIGKAVWSPTNKSLLKFGDGNFITIGEEEADDRLTIKAAELFFKPSAAYNSLPITFTGTQNLSHFFFGPNEDTYIRSGKNGSNVNINDVGGGRVGIGMASPNRAMLEQNGVVGNTAAIFGGDGAGISLQRNWPVVGFNHYYNGGQKSISSGWAGYLALSQDDGSLSYSSFGDLIAPSANSDMGAASAQFSVSRKGNAFVNGNLYLNNNTDGAALTVRQSFANYYDYNKNGIRFEEIVPDGIYKWNISGNSNFIFAYDGVFKASISGTDGSYFYPSDLRLKKNISSITENALSKISALRPVNYLMKEETEGSKQHIGFISQEVEKIFPEVVSENRGIKMMNYTGLIPILTKGIQEQQQQIEDLKKEVAELKRLILSKN